MEMSRLLSILHFPMRLIFLASWLLSTVYTESHSLWYYFSTTSSPGPGQPYYHVGGYVDDVQFARYTSDTHEVQPLLPCVENVMGPQHWEYQTKIARHYEQRHKQTIQDIKKYFNQTKGDRDTYVFQVKFWCEMSKDNSISGYEEFAANGEKFIVLDTSLLEFLPLNPEAEMISLDWNTRKFSAEKQKMYMENECITWLKSYLPCMKECLSPVPPQMKISGHQASGVTKLHCQVYGFHPRAVDVKWVKNERDEVPSDETRQTLPNPDGTYQTRASLEVAAGEEGNYSCHVDHSSLEETLIGKWEPKMNIKQPALRIGTLVAIAAVAVLVIILFAVIFICKRTPGHMQNSDREPD